MGKITLTIVLGPVGAGKSTFIEEMKANNPNLIHICPDDILDKLMADYIHTRRELGLPIIDAEMNGPNLGVPQVYKSQVKRAIEDAKHSDTDTHIVIDNIPSCGRDEPWANQLAFLGKRWAQPQDITINAVVMTANPENTFERVLNREWNKKDMDGQERRYPDNPPDIMRPDHFRIYLDTHRCLPEQADMLTRISDCTSSKYVGSLRIYDTNGTERKLIAAHERDTGWRIYDSTAYAAHNRLREVTPWAASFEIRDVRLVQEKNALTHQFKAKPIRFFGADTPTSAPSTPPGRHEFA